MTLRTAHFVDPVTWSRHRTSGEALVVPHRFEDRDDAVLGYVLRWESPTLGERQSVVAEFRAQAHQSFEFTPPGGSAVRVVYETAPRHSSSAMTVELRCTPFS